MSSLRTLDYIRATPDAPLTSTERSYAAALHGPATRRRLNTLFSAVLCGRIDGFHAEPDGWLVDGRALLASELSNARGSLLTDQEWSRGMQAGKQTLTPESLLRLLLDTRAALDTRRRVKALRALSDKDRFTISQELAA